MYDVERIVIDCELLMMNEFILKKIKCSNVRMFEGSLVLGPWVLGPRGWVLGCGGR